MDSRIREIEQWLDEAKTDLQDGGREAYLRKLYLLDAEIRAVIKNNDPLPEMLTASTGRRPARKFNLPVAVAGFAALALISSAVVLGQGSLWATVNPGTVTSDLADASSNGDVLTMASLNRFPRGEELVTLEDLDGGAASLDFNLLDHSRVLAALASEDFNPDAPAGLHQQQTASSFGGGSPLIAAAPQTRRGPVGDIGDDAQAFGKSSGSQYTGVEVTLAMARDSQSDAQGVQPASVALPPDQPTLSSLSQTQDNSAQSDTVTEKGNFYYFPGYGDSSGVDPKGSSSGANGRSSEVLLTGRKGESKAQDSKVERKLDKAELKKIAEDRLRSKESKDS